MERRFNGIKPFSLIKSLCALFVFLMIVAYFIPIIFGSYPLEFNLIRAISNWPLPTLAVVFAYVALKYYGYVIDDIGIAYCSVTKKGWSYASTIDWCDIIRIEYRPASIINFFSGRVIVHSSHKDRIIISDVLINFKEIVQIIYEKTNVAPDYLGKELEKIINS